MNVQDLQWRVGCDSGDTRFSQCMKRPVGWMMTRNPRGIIRKAFDENWILITNDKDFGEKVYRERYPHRGIVLLRLGNERASSKIGAVQQLLDSYAEEIPDCFVVVKETRVRFARG